MQNEIKAAESLLNGTQISVLDAARLIRNALDYAENDGKDNLQYCREVIECGTRHVGRISRKMTISAAFGEYLETKKSLRKESLRDIKYLGNRILKHFDKSRLISEISTEECSKLLEETFTTPSQQNKGRTMLHGLFNYAVKMKWCAENPISEISPKKVVEREIQPLSIAQIQRLLKCTLSEHHCDCAAAIGIMLWAGIRPEEVSRLTWKDVDLDERVIVVRHRNSKREAQGISTFARPCGIGSEKSKIVMDKSARKQDAKMASFAYRCWLRTLDARCPAPHIRDIQFEAFPQPAQTAIRDGTRRFLANKNTLRQYGEYNCGVPQIRTVS